MLIAHTYWHDIDESLVFILSIIYRLWILSKKKVKFPYFNIFSSWKYIWNKSWFETSTLNLNFSQTNEFHALNMPPHSFKNISLHFSYGSMYLCGMNSCIYKSWWHCIVLKQTSRQHNMNLCINEQSIQNALTF